MTMKRGCFLSAITLLTIIVMVGLYLYKSNKDWFKEFGKDRIVNLVTEEVNENLGKLHPGPFNDSVRVLVKKELKYIHSGNFENTMDEFGFVMEKIKHYSADGDIDSAEYNQLKTLVMEHERSKKN